MRGLVACNCSRGRYVLSFSRILCIAVSLEDLSCLVDVRSSVLIRDDGGFDRVCCWRVGCAAS